MNQTTNTANAPSRQVPVERQQVPEQHNYLRRRVVAAVAVVALSAGGIAGVEWVGNKLKHNNEKLSVPAPDSHPLTYKVQDGDTSVSVAGHFKSGDGSHLEQLADLVEREEAQLHPNGMPMQVGDVISVPRQQGDTTFTRLTDAQYETLHNGSNG